MKFFNKSIFEIQFLIPHRLLRTIKKTIQFLKLPKWKIDGSPVPPPHLVKVSLLKKLAKKHRLSLFIETGTFMGDMVDEMLNSFEEIYSIELFDPLYQRAKKIFKKHKHVHIFHGNSVEILPKIIEKTSEPILFWLDAHYSGSGTAKLDEIDTPIEKELKIINKIANKHVVVIDDARCFNGTDGYPKLASLINRYQDKYEIDKVNDMIILA